MAEEQQASGVGPLQVVEDEHDGLAFGRRRQERHHGGEEEEALGVGVGRLRCREVRDPAGQLRDQPGQLGAVRADVGQELVVGRWAT